MTAATARDGSLPVNPVQKIKVATGFLQPVTLWVQDLTGCTIWIPEVCPKVCFCLAVKLCLGLRNVLWYCVSAQRGDYTAVNEYFPLLSSVSSFVPVNCCLLGWKPACNV